jgi:hypothetical protein
MATPVAVRAATTVDPHTKDILPDVSPDIARAVPDVVPAVIVLAMFYPIRTKYL